MNDFTPLSALAGGVLIGLSASLFLLAHGKVAGDIPAISDGAQRLARAIASMLFDADRDSHYAALQAFDKAELAGDEWTDADAPSVIDES